MTDYYINAGTGNDSLDGLSRTVSGGAGPWLTFTYAFKQLSAGDTLYVDGSTDFDNAGGTTVWPKIYTIGQQANYNDGTAVSPITVEQYSGATARIKGIGTSATNNGWFMKNYWTFRGLTFHQSQNIYFGDNVGGAPSYECKGLRIYDCTFQHTPNTTTSRVGTIGLLQVDDVIIQGCTFDNLRSRDLGRDWIAIRIRNANNVTVNGNTATDIGADFLHVADSFTITNLTVEDNNISIIRGYVERDEDGATVDPPTFAGVGETGIDIKSGPGPIYVQDNVIHGYRKSNPATQDTDGGYGTGIVFHQTLADGEYHIRRNLIYDCEQALVCAAFSTPGNKGIQIYNNIIVTDTADTDAYVASTTYSLRHTGAYDSIIENNTFWLKADITHEIFQFNGASDTIDFQNNIVSSTGASKNASGWSWSGTPNASDYNCFYQVTNVDADYTGANDISTNPTLDANYTPDSAWTGVNGGTSTGYSQDYYSSPRPGAGTSSTAYDIGAVEYQDDSSAPQPSPLPAYTLRRKISA